MHYEIIDIPENNNEINDLITWAPITTSKALKISHGESISYLSVESLDSMQKINKLINPLSNTEYPSDIKNIILDTIKICNNELLFTQLDEKIKNLESFNMTLGYYLENNRGHNLYENFIDHKLKILEILDLVDNYDKDKINPTQLLSCVKLKNELEDTENKLITYKEHLYYSLMLVDIFMGRKLDIEIPFVTQMNIPVNIINDSCQYRLTGLNISISNVKNKIKKEHNVIINNLNDIIKLISYDYFNHVNVWLENIKWIGHINLSTLAKGRFRFDLYDSNQEIIFPNSIYSLQLKSHITYRLDLFYIKSINWMEINGDFEFISLPKWVGELVWKLKSPSIESCRQFTKLMNYKNFDFKEITLSSENVDSLNSILRMISPVFFYSSSRVLTSLDMNTGEEKNYYSVDIRKRMCSPFVW